MYVKNFFLYFCKECNWGFSVSKYKLCPICNNPPEIDEDLAIQLVQEYYYKTDNFLKSNQARKIVSKFKQNYGRYPNFDDIKTLIKGDTFGRGGLERVSIEDKISKKMAEMKGEPPKVKKAIERVEEIEPELEEPIQFEEEGEDGSICSKCGNLNPIGSKFCLECGNILEELPKVDKIEFPVEDKTEVPEKRNKIEDALTKSGINLKDDE